MPAAVLWDMDGTLVDTEPYWLQAQLELAARFDVPWTHEDGLGLVGSGLWASARIIQSHGIDLSEDEIVHNQTDRVRALIDESGVPWQPGAQELLRAVRDAGIPTALVTMSIASMAEQIVATIPFDAFDLLVTGDIVTESKPHPEPYLTAAHRLGVDAASCVAIEDSPPGLASARAAGTVSIGVPHIVGLADDAADAVWTTLANRTLDDLLAVFAQARA